MRKNTIDLTVQAKDSASKTLNNVGESIENIDKRSSIAQIGIVALGNVISNAVTGAFSFFHQTVNNAIDSIVSFGRSASTIAMDFDASMRQVGAVSNATNDELSRLTKTAREQARITKFTATQSADAMNFLAMAGFKVDEIIDALPGTLELASASNLDLASSADIVSNILTGYGLEVKELSRANDVLVKSLTSTNVDLRMLGESFKYVGPVAVSAGLEFEEVSAAIGLMGNAGIQGSMAGTSLRGAITRLLSPTKQVREVMKKLKLDVTNADGSMKSLVDIVRQLEDSGADTADMMLLFGQRAGPAMSALVAQGNEALSGLTNELLSASGTASRVSKEMMEGPRGAILELQSMYEDFQISLGDVINDVVAGSGLIDVLNQGLEQASQFFADFGIGVQNKMPEIKSAFGELWESIKDLLRDIGLLGSETEGAFGDGITAGETFADTLVILIEKATDFVRYLAENKEGIKSFFNDVTATAKGLWDIVKLIVNGIGTLSRFNARAEAYNKQGYLTPVAALMSGFDVLQGRATGGSVSAGTPYIVGEQGRELFIPRENGRIVPNNKTESMAQKTINIVNNFASYVDPEIVASRLAFQMGVQ